MGVESSRGTNRSKVADLAPEGCFPGADDVSIVVFDVSIGDVGHDVLVFIHDVLVFDVSIGDVNVSIGVFDVSIGDVEHDVLVFIHDVLVSDVSIGVSGCGGRATRESKLDECHTAKAYLRLVSPM
jgi:hypothetical protein